MVVAPKVSSESFPDTGQRSVHLRASVLDDLATPRHFGLDQVAERFRRVRREIDALRDEALLHVRQLQHAHDFAVFIANEIKRWSGVVRKANISLETQK